ncbi:MAG: pyrophosphohydrolase [Desulfobacteraceae bacterium]|nr:MAG: pyrophosphohydrolase [Desulfobacteraceae bacterium]
MLTLKLNPTLQDYQNYVRELENERGFSDQSARDKCLLLGEEIGELFKSIRKAEGLSIDKNSNFKSIADEIADIFIYICSIANRYGIDMEAAFKQKEEQNKNRTWNSV